MTVLARRLAVTLVASFALAASLRGQSPREEELARSQYQSGLDFLQSRRYARRSRIFKPSSTRFRRARSLMRRSCKSRCTSSTWHATRMRRKPPTTSC
jgi:hypothetical protein